MLCNLWWKAEQPLGLLRIRRWAQTPRARAGGFKKLLLQRETTLTLMQHEKGPKTLGWSHKARYNQILSSWVKFTLIEVESSQAEQNWSESAVGSSCRLPRGFCWWVCSVLSSGFGHLFYPLQPNRSELISWNSHADESSGYLMADRRTAHKGCVRICFISLLWPSGITFGNILYNVDFITLWVLSLTCHVLCFISACVANRTERFTVELKKWSAL